MEHGGVNSGETGDHCGGLTVRYKQDLVVAEKSVLGPCHSFSGAWKTGKGWRAKCPKQQDHGTILRWRRLVTLRFSLLVHFSGCSLPNSGVEGCPWRVF